MKKFDAASFVIAVIAICLVGLTGAGVVISQERAEEKEITIGLGLKLSDTAVYYAQHARLKPDLHSDHVKEIENVVKKYKVVNHDTVEVILTVTTDYFWEALTDEEKQKIIDR